MVASKIAPNAAVHSAYYAMEFAASAVLLLNGGVDKFGDMLGGHAHIVEHFAKLTKDEPGFAALVEALQQAKADRLLADYGMGESLSAADALKVLRAADDFVVKCEKRWPTPKQ